MTMNRQSGGTTTDQLNHVSLNMNKMPGQKNISTTQPGQGTYFYCGCSLPDSYLFIYIFLSFFLVELVCQGTINEGEEVDPTR